MSVFTIIEHDDGVVPAACLQALTIAGELAAGDTVEAVVFGPDPGLGSVLAANGVTTLHVVDHELVTDYSPEIYGESLAQLLKQAGPAGVVAAGTDRGNEIMAQAAARSRLPLATNCVAVTADPGAWTLTRARVGGLLLEDAELTASTKLVTVVPGPGDDVSASPGASGLLTQTFVPDLAADFVHSRLVERTERGSGVTLATARVVVSGGRGVGSSEGFAPLEELADLLGGAVGCSRVATSNGWRPHSDQVGQTGTKVSPELYIACGISGATQHWVGCMGAKTILAINTDPEAPMVTRATYAVTGDVHEVVPAVVAEIRRRADIRAGRRPALA
ncbi:electron transfer flavoprotein subunit alpha/FixB family protein [Haloactinopolyspora sp.]|uniref:electron transfer flavoprotein subunit alpha/FixB family protein n=1 Tax=Haloactinopolyspora sp. TaxID=1966353 RepID=UPI00262BD4A3|nr:electron transfer flavoprotein subunit alpha/FixB family protein [Haloactinopolyspora sp.]